jgi:hypothetical protein
MYGNGVGIGMEHIPMEQRHRITREQLRTRIVLLVGAVGTTVRCTAPWQTGCTEIRLTSATLLVYGWCAAEYKLKKITRPRGWSV